MATIYEIRVENLRALVRDRGALSVAKACGYSNASFISQMAGKNPTSPVTETTARKIEHGLALPEYWLDVERDAVGRTVAPLKTKAAAQNALPPLRCSIRPVQQPAQPPYRKRWPQPARSWITQKL